MNIIWVDKTANYDTRGVTRIWFEKNQIRYTLEADERYHVYSAKQKEIQIILTDEAYATTKRNVGII